MNQEFNLLRNECFKLMIDSGIKLKIHGNLCKLVDQLSAYMAEDVHISTVSNALSGYRTGKRSVQILEAIKTILSINGDYTHLKENCNLNEAGKPSHDHSLTDPSV